jgi:hypothetical protein
MRIPFLSTAIFTLLLLSACEREKESFQVVDTVPVFPRGDINRFYQGMDRRPDTVFLIDNGIAATLRTAGGVILEIPAGSFAFPGGEAVTGAVRIQWKEVRSIYDQVARRISLRHEEQLLQSELLFEWLVDREGVALILTQPVTIKWPATQSAGNLGLWYGRHREAQDYLWEEAPPGSVSLSSWVDPVLGAGANGYLLALDRTGACSAARPEWIPAPNGGTLETRLFPAYNSGNTSVWFLDPVSRRAIALRDSGNGHFYLPLIARGAPGRLFCVTEAVRHRYFSAWLDLQVNADTLVWEARPTEKDLGLLHSMISSF